MQQLKLDKDRSTREQLVLVAQKADSETASPKAISAETTEPKEPTEFSLQLDETTLEQLGELGIIGTKSNDTNSTEKPKSTTAEAETANTEDPEDSEEHSSVPVEGSEEKETSKEETSPEATPVAKPIKHLSPREIQTRIRAGESIDDLVAESGMAVSKIEAFAHPILAERSRMANLAHNAHPVRQDGPAALTLWEVLATSFASRGMNLEEATWDAYRDDSRVWIVVVSWNSGLAQLHAEWSYHQEGATATAVARNEMATELVDPDFGRPTQRNTSPRGLRRDTTAPSDGSEHGIDEDFIYSEEEPPAQRPVDNHPARRTRARASRRSIGRMEIVGLGDNNRRDKTSESPEDSTTDSAGQRGGNRTSAEVPFGSAPAHTEGHTSSAAGSAPGAQGSHGSQGSHGGSADSSPAAADTDESTGFLEHPDGSPKRRRRRAVTPHWEDVLLGVRPTKDRGDK